MSARVNAADTQLARDVWAEREGLAFIHPLGHKRGWPQIKTNFYEKLMGGMFLARWSAAQRPRPGILKQSHVHR